MDCVEIGWDTVWIEESDCRKYNQENPDLTSKKSDGILRPRAYERLLVSPRRTALMQRDAASACPK